MSDTDGQTTASDTADRGVPAPSVRPAPRGKKRYRPLVESFIERSPVTTLLIVSLVCVLILLVAMALVLNDWTVQRVPVVREEKELYSALGSLFQGIIGSSFALAGSIVAIYLAVLGLRVVRDQERREQEQYVRTYLSEALLPINKIARSVSDLTFAYINLMHYAVRPWEGMTGAAADTQVRSKNDALVRAVMNLAGDLESMCLSPQSLHLWGCSNSAPKDYLPKLWRASGNATPCPNATSDPVRYAAYLKAGAARFKEASEVGRPTDAWETMVKAVRVYVHLVQEKRGAEFDFDEREFTGLGISLWISGMADAAFNFGLATLLDIVDAIPDEAELRLFTEQEFDIDIGDSNTNPFASRLRKFMRNNDPARLAEPRLLRVAELWGGDVKNLYLKGKLRAPEGEKGDKRA